MFDVLNKITLLREERGWSTYKLSKLSGIPQSTIATWYKRNLMPPIDKLEILCQTFGISLADFFNDTDTILSLTDEQKDALHKWNLLTPNQRKALLLVMDMLYTKE